MDITDTLAPKSDQLDAVDLLGGPQTFTITGVSRNADGEQPVNITLAEFPRIWRPGKRMRRVMAALWGPETKVWETRRVQPLPDEPTLDERLASLRAEWDLVPEKSPRREEIRAEVTRLRGGPAPAPAPAPVEEPAADVVVPEEGPAYNARTGEVVDPGPDVDVQDPPPYDPAQEPAGWAVQS
jgi:hypothetical protein